MNLEKIKIENIFIRAFLGELIGTYILCFIGNGATHEAVIQGTHQGFSVENRVREFEGNHSSVHVPLAFGLAVAIGIFSCAGVIGGHINPAVSFAHAILGKMDKNTKRNWSLFGVVVSAQLLGGFLASAVLYSIYSTGEEFLKLNNATTGTGSPACFFDLTFSGFKSLKSGAKWSLLHMANRYIQ